MCGFEITQTVKSLRQGKPEIGEGALYPVLHQLEGEGLLEARLENIGNRVRKYYSLSQAGKKETQKSKLETLQFLKTLEIFLKPKLV